MRSSKNRSRSKQNRNRSVGNIVNRVFDSSGPEGKVRGTPQQIIDKYNQLARDAQLGNDRVAAENFQQHAEHYLRMLSEGQKELDAQREQQEREAQARRERQDAERNNQNNNRRRDDAEPGSGGGGQNAGEAEWRQPARSDEADAAPAEDAPDAPDAPKPARARSPKPRTPRARGDAPGEARAAEDAGSTLVETPEDKPKRRTRARKPKLEGETSETGGKDDTPAAAE